MRIAWHSLVVVVVLGLSALGTHAAGQQQQPEPTEGDVGARIAAIDAQITRERGKIETGRARLAALESEQTPLLERKTAASRSLRTRVRALYRLSRAGLLPASGGFEAILDHLARLSRLRRLAAKELEVVEALDVRRAEVAAQMEGLRAEGGRLQVAVAELGTLRRSLEQEELMAQELTATLAGSYGAGEPEYGADEPEYGVIRVVRDNGRSERGFVALRGSLAMPVSGDFVVRNARREDGPGVELVARPGTPVRAVADGRVAFSDRYASYGQLVIIDHGGGYYTIYGGLGAVDVHVGDELSRGARMGDIGSDARGAALFFEVRRGTRTLDARDWLGL